MAFLVGVSTPPASLPRDPGFIRIVGPAVLDLGVPNRTTSSLPGAPQTMSHAEGSQKGTPHARSDTTSQITGIPPSEGQQRDCLHLHFLSSRVFCPADVSGC